MMNVICIEEEAFYQLIETVIDRLGSRLSHREKWITSEDAMRKLNISSKTTLQKYRDEGKIKFSQRDRWHILYDADSIDAFIEQHIHHIF